MSARHLIVIAGVSMPGMSETRMRVIYIVGDGSTPEPFVPWIDYVHETGGLRRHAWQREAAGAVRDLLDFVAATGTDANSIGKETLRAFAQALLFGTSVLDVPHKRLDVDWPPRSHDRAIRCLSLVTAFLDWLAERTGRASANPWRTATPAERLVRLRHLDKRAACSLLSHAAYRQRDAVAAGLVREVGIARKATDVPFDEARAFDDQAFERLLVQGFGRPAPDCAPLARRLRLREALLAILLHGGGLRLSEPFHLYLGDVREDPLRPGSALVRLFHPEQGRAPAEDGRRWRDREHYLRERWNRLPRTLELGRFHAGWKNLALSDGSAKCAFVEWFPAHWGVVFLRLFRLYLQHRPRARHPFLFVSEHRAHRGEPYTIEAFEQAHAHAVRRAGLVPIKAQGTTPHGHRHAFGRRLRRAGVDSLFIQRAMHHRSPDSQRVYTAPSAAELAEAVRLAEARLSAPISHLFEEDGHENP